ncbi:MAG: hypothetical protein HLUCCO18_06050 [Rhodobacteraceae bacterium HLUCCO18]|nr:MAG: hypothetical protein HLUCCO18_06050 [Rhodobacteraceae bacterium HLUCCO18]
MRLSPILFSCLMAASPALAESDAAPRLSLELNRLDALDGACRLTFMAENTLGADLEALALETVLIATDGQVERLTLFEFGTLPNGVPRVRQFDVPGLACEGLGRVLINGVSECNGAEACGAALSLSSRTDVELIG